MMSLQGVGHEDPAGASVAGASENQQQLYGFITCLKVDSGVFRAGTCVLAFRRAWGIPMVFTLSQIPKQNLSNDELAHLGEVQS